jgi:hypothetical protein
MQKYFTSITCLLNHGKFRLSGAAFDNKEGNTAIVTPVVYASHLGVGESDRCFRSTV